MRECVYIDAQNNNTHTHTHSTHARTHTHAHTQGSCSQVDCTAFRVPSNGQALHSCIVAACCHPHHKSQCSEPAPTSKGLGICYVQWFTLHWLKLSTLLMMAKRPKQLSRVGVLTQWRMSFVETHTHTQRQTNTLASITSWWARAIKVRLLLWLNDSEMSWPNV